MAKSRKRRKKSLSGPRLTTKSGACKFGKVTRGKRKGRCRKARKAKKK